MLKSKVVAKLVSESEFNNASIRNRLLKLQSRIANLEKFNIRNEKELGLAQVLGEKVTAYVKLSRDVENISYSEENLVYYNLNILSIRNLEIVRTEVEEIFRMYDGMESILLGKLRESLKKTRLLLDLKTTEFANFTITYKFV